MATPYSNIYVRAINLFDDPKITSAFENNPIDFYQIMYGYLNNAIPLFITPTAMQAKLNDRTKPTGQTELFDGNGLTNSFHLSTTPPTGAMFNYIVGNAVATGNFNYLTNNATLDVIPPIGTHNVSIEWYADGQFNQTLIDRQEMILALQLVRCWGEKEKNFLMDIRRLLQDTDFKLISEANSTNSKTNWFATIREEAEKEMNNYAWDVYQENLRLKYGIPKNVIGV